MKEILETDDVGDILRTLRENQGFSIVQMSKKTGLSPEKISRTERSDMQLPNEAVLRMWLQKLGCKENLRKILLLAKQHRVVHHLRLKSKDISNNDIVRVMEAYKDGLLSEFDRDVLSILARD